MTLTKPKATIEDLYEVDEKAEIVNGEIIRFMATGRLPGYAADEVFVSLRQYAKQQHDGSIAVGDNKAFYVRLPNRTSFSPDAAYYVGPNSGMKFYEGAPVFAVEVRSENDYGLTAEVDMAAKRRDYFAAGTQTVWDVDLLSEQGASVIRKYIAATGADTPAAIFAPSEVADALPALPGWAMPVDDLFEGQ